MKIIGIDPGTNQTGYGIISQSGKEFTYNHSGVISLPKSCQMSERLKIIYRELNKVIKFYKPDIAVIETAFYGKNIQSTLKLGYARGIAILVSANNNLQIEEYSPREIKKAVVGNGSASKQQVQYMIKSTFGLKHRMKFDESDSLAVAMCYALRNKTGKSKLKSWNAFIQENPDRIVKN
ncbi:MAG: crossover junction endodeoxyribonuclease RuvC [Ignavibacteriales bacterium]|nr:crossover junction endodeoxyribonuclease RuvC [Ignavibacteriales bacterium]